MVSSFTKWMLRLSVMACIGLVGVLVFQRGQKPTSPQQTGGSLVAVRKSDTPANNPLPLLASAPSDATRVFKTKFVAATGPKPKTLDELLKMPPTDRQKVDIGRVNLLCAQGLPGSADLDVEKMDAKMDEMAQLVATMTEKLSPRYWLYQDKFGTEAQFRATVLCAILQDAFHVHYNPDYINDAKVTPADEVFFADSSDSFIHGLLGKNAAGTCASMPVLYVAVGRRLGYPMKFAVAMLHGLAQWDDGKEHFNIEATAHGSSIKPDEFYRTWPKPVSVQAWNSYHMLQSMNPDEELAVFLRIRCTVLRVAKRFDEARFVASKLPELSPGWGQNEQVLLELESAQYFTQFGLPSPIRPGP